MALYGSDIQMGSTVSIDIQSKAVLLMVYEMIAMFLILRYYTSTFTLTIQKLEMLNLNLIYLDGYS